MRKALLFPVLLCSLPLSSCGQDFNVKEYMSDLQFHDNFKIVQLSDLHLSSQRNLQVDYDYLTNLIKVAQKDGQVDLVIITGDLFTFATKETIQKTFKTFNDWGIPWTLTFGNHDEQIYAGFTYAAEEAGTGKYSNCKYKYLDDNMTGLTNSVINLKDGDDVKYQLFIIDSNTYSYQYGIGYDWVHQDQIDWYEKCIREVNGASWNPGDTNTIPSLIFQHIPLVEFKDATKALEEKTGTATKIGDGDNKESNSPAKYNSGFFAKIAELKSTKGISVGHDHINNTDIRYTDPNTGYVCDFIYGAKSTDNIYHNDDQLGYRQFFLKADGTFTSELVFMNYATAAERAK